MHGLHTWWLCWVIILSGTTLLYYHFSYARSRLFTSFSIFASHTCHVIVHLTIPFCSVVVLFCCYTHAYISVYAYCNNSGSVPYKQQVPITLTVILVTNCFNVHTRTMQYQSRLRNAQEHCENEREYKKWFLFLSQELILQNFAYEIWAYVIITQQRCAYGNILDHSKPDCGLWSVSSSHNIDTWQLGLEMWSWSYQTCNNSAQKFFMQRSSSMVAGREDYDLSAFVSVHRLIQDRAHSPNRTGVGYILLVAGWQVCQTLAQREPASALPPAEEDTKETPTL